MLRHKADTDGIDIASTRSLIEGGLIATGDGGIDITVQAELLVSTTDSDGSTSTDSTIGLDDFIVTKW